MGTSNIKAMMRSRIKIATCVAMATMLPVASQTALGQVCGGPLDAACGPFPYQYFPGETVLSHGQRLNQYLACKNAWLRCANALPGNRWEDQSPERQMQICQQKMAEAAGACQAANANPNAHVMGALCRGDNIFLTNHCR